MNNGTPMVDEIFDPNENREILATLKDCEEALNAMIRGIEKGVGTTTLVLATLQGLQTAFDSVFDEVVLRAGISQTNLWQ